jgi:aminoglycoside phosphotransferase (APT) family kinase protein
VTAGKMHADEADIDMVLVCRLVATQFPRWADLPIRPDLSAGTDNAMYRLGEDMTVLLPRIEGAVENVGREQRWLPLLAPLLPVAIPVPFEEGKPAEGYPYPWSVCRRLEDENPTAGRLADPGLLARDLAGFVAALRGIDPADGPPGSTETCHPAACCSSMDASAPPLISGAWEWAIPPST